MPSTPPSRPMPEKFVPPKGASEAARAKELTPTIPAFNSATVRRARGRRTRERIGRKAHYAGVGALDRLVVGPESRDCRNRSEVLLRHDLHGVGDVGQHGRVEEMTG